MRRATRSFMNSSSKCCKSPYRRRVSIATALMALVPLLPSGAFAVQINVLFVSNGYYQQENDIYSHLQNLTVFDVTIKKNCNINGSTDLKPYDLIIISDFEPNISNNGLTNIDDESRPYIFFYWHEQKV